jgi:hypothetical protein
MLDLEVFFELRTEVEDAANGNGDKGLLGAEEGASMAGAEKTARRVGIELNSGRLW